MTVGITAPLVGAGAAMMNAFMEFDSVMAELQARTGATAEEMKKMEAFAIEMGATTAFSAKEAAQALLELTSSGSSAAEAMQQLPAVLDLAAAGALELGRAADGVTDILAQFQLEAEDSAMVANQLAKAAGASSATVEDLLQAFSNAGPVMAQFGLSVEESAAALAVMAENGIKGAEAGTQLKSMLLNMSRDTETVANAWETLGVSMFDAQGNMRDIDDIFKDINKAMAGMSMEEQVRLSQDLAGSYGLVGFNALRASNGISDMQGAMANAAGASEVADARMNTMAGALDQLMGSLETLGIVLGGLAEGPLTELVKWLTDVVNAVTAWVQANPQLAQFVLIILAILAAIGPLLIVIGQVIGAIVAIKAGLIALGAAAMLPLLPIALLVAGLVLLALAIFNNWFGIRDIIWGAIQAIVDAIYWFLDVVSQLATGFAGALGMIGQGWQKMLQAAQTSLTQLGGIIAIGFMKAFNSAVQSVTQFGQMIWQRLSTLGSQMMQLGQAIINGLLNGIKSKAVELVAYIFGLSKDMENAIKQALGISSPSKVFMKMGENVALGFQQGVSSLGAGIGVNVPQTASALSGGGNLVGGRSGGGGVSTTTNYNTFVLPEGTTDKQVREIEKRLGRNAKKRGARGY